MFDHLQRELRRLASTTEISVPLEADEEGYADKECPAEACLFSFKVHGDDWSNIVRDEEVFCPSCRHCAPARSWYTTEQIKRAKEYAVRELQGRINGAMRRDAQSWNRRQPRNAFISMTMNVKGSSPVLLPISAAEPMRLRTACEACGCRYSYIGAAYFCPSCGENSAHHTFKQTLTTIRTSAGMGEGLRQLLGRDEAEVVRRALLEKGMQDTVMSFQRLAEQLYERLPAAPAARRNVFQNLAAGSALWDAAITAPYSGIVDAASLARLKVYFQQRHLLAHQQGIVDQDYRDKSGDTSYADGQRIIVSEEDVRRFADLTEALGDGLIQACADYRAAHP